MDLYVCICIGTYSKTDANEALNRAHTESANNERLNARIAAKAKTHDDNITSRANFAHISSQSCCFKIPESMSYMLKVQLYGLEAVFPQPLE